MGSVRWRRGALEGVAACCSGDRCQGRSSFRRAAGGGTVDETLQRKAEKQEEREREPGEGFATSFVRRSGPPTLVVFCIVGKGRGGAWHGGGLQGQSRGIAGGLEKPLVRPEASLAARRGIWSGLACFVVAEVVPVVCGALGRGGGPGG